MPRPCTRRTDHTLPCTKTKGTRRRLDVHRVSTVQAHGEQPPMPSAGRDGVCSLFSPCAYIYTWRIGLPCARLLAHGKQGLCRPRGCRPRFAVGHHRRSLRRVPTCLRRVPRAHGELVVSGCASGKGGANFLFLKTGWSQLIFFPVDTHVPIPYPARCFSLCTASQVARL